MKEILFLEPVFTHNIWGGTKLRTEFGYDVMGEDIGECWGIAAHEHGDCRIKNGIYEGKHLSELWKDNPELFGNFPGERFPLLTKIIDAKEDLSIQVHPDDTYAKTHENGSYGKMECWYILDCKKDATIVIGHNAQNEDELKDMILQGQWSSFIREIPIEKGDLLQIDPGCVHAIKGGTVLLESQQNSDITYRVYDYDRLSDGKPRPLHVKQSMDVITVPAKDPKQSVIHTKQAPMNTLCALIACSKYKIYKLQMDKEMHFYQEEPFMLVSIVSGQGKINGVDIKMGDHFILPNAYGKVELEGTLEAIISSPV